MIRNGKTMILHVKSCIYTYVVEDILQTRR